MKQISAALEEDKKLRQKLVHSGQMHRIHWLIISLSIILTIGAWYYSNEQVYQKIEERFERESSHVIELVKERLQLYEHALWGSVAYIDASENKITSKLWYEYASSLKIDKTYPGVNGIGIIHNIKPEQLADYLAKEKKLRPNYSIHPQHDESEYWPITFIEPTVSNRQAVGLDMAFETNRYTGIKKARDTGRAQLTGPIILVQDDKKTPGFLLYAPFYKKGSIHNSVASRREQIVGVSYAPFIMYKLISGTLAIEKRHVSINISDDGDFLYDDVNNVESMNIDPEPLFSKNVKVNLYGRQWDFIIESNLTFREAAASNLPSFILAGGIIIDLLLLGLFIFLSRASRQALAYADQMTNDLIVKTEGLEKSNQDLEQFAYIASHDLKSPLNAIQRLVNWITEDCEDILPDSAKEYLKLLDNRSNRMNKLLDDLLHYARIGRFNYASESIQLDQLVNDIFSFLDPPKNFILEAQAQDIVIPKIPLEIVLRNLIANAIKHHDKSEGKVVVSYQECEGKHQIRVQDDGPGIPPELFGKATEMFQTLQPRDKVEGSGMGLALAKKIIEHYEGFMSIESDGVKGTGIIIIWPLENNKV